MSKIYEGTTLNDNLRKHADAPKIPSQKHPHPEYSDLERIKLRMMDPQLLELQDKLDTIDAKGNHTNPEWFNQITVDDIKCNCPHRDKFEQLFDKEDNECKTMCWTACKHTTFAAAKRQMKAAPTPDPAVADDFVEYSKHIIDKEMGEELRHFGYSVNDWMNHLTSIKQKALQHVINYYKGDITNIPPKELSNIIKMHYTGILKEELQALDGKPRMVCSVPQRVKYIMGPITWQLEEIAQNNFKGYCGGKNLDQMADMINTYLAQGFTKVVEGDGSAFDNTQDVSLKAVDRYMYQQIADKIYHVPKKDFIKVSQALYKTMDIEYIENGKKKSLLRYKILGTVFSGDCDTTLMNTIRMALYNRYVNDKAGLVYGQDYICFSKGDDFTLMYKPYVTNEFITQAYYRFFLDKNPDPSQPDASIYGLGQVLKFLEFGGADIIKFCSLNSWYTDTTETKIYLTRDIKKFLNISKYSRKTKSYNIPQKIQYCRDQALALRASYAKITLFETIADMYTKLADRLQHDYKIPETTLTYMRLKQQQKRKNEIITHAYDVNYMVNMEQQSSEFVKHRQVQYKIHDNYWETMQQIEKAHLRTLTDSEAKYISALIEHEISISVIKSMYDVGRKLKY